MSKKILCLLWWVSQTRRSTPDHEDIGTSNLTNAEIILVAAKLTIEDPTVSIVYPNAC